MKLLLSRGAIVITFNYKRVYIVVIIIIIIIIIARNIKSPTLYTAGRDYASRAPAISPRYEIALGSPVYVLIISRPRNKAAFFA